MASLPKSDQTRARILEAATEEFALMGLSGARVEAIAARTTTSKRMIYHYFGSKQGLYMAALENAYQAMREQEADLGLDAMPPVQALRKLVETTFDHHELHPNFIRLVRIENVLFGEHIRRSETIKKTNSAAVPLLAEILRRGFEEKVFTKNIEATDLHFMISALCVFRVEHRHTFSTVVDRDIFEPEVRDRHRQIVVEAVLGIVGASDSNEKTDGAQSDEAPYLLRPTGSGGRS